MAQAAGSPKRQAKLADFEVKEKVGQGAQGSVFRALHIPSQQLVALKQIDVSYLSEKERTNVLAEVKVLATLAEDPHMCVCTYQDSFVEDGSLWIALEWSANGTLQDLFSRVQKKKRPEFEEDEIWQFFLSLALALDHIHGMHILHRDVKMANVFLHYPEASSPLSASSGGGALPRVQLGDFGVSTILDDRSRAMTMVGTPYYLSPELCMGKPYSSKSDVWSLGVVLYVLLNQKMPYEASNYAALILRIVQDDHAKHQQPSTKYSAVLRRMATWCMQKEERSRPTARELLLHPDCLRRLIRLGLPMTADLLEAACYDPAPTPEPSGSAVTSKSIASDDASRPLPIRRVPSGGIPLSVHSRRKVRVVQGVSNMPPPAQLQLSSALAVRQASASRAPQKKSFAGPKLSVGSVMSPHVAQGPPAIATKPTSSSSLRKPPARKDVAAVAQLPRYDGGSSEDEGHTGTGGEATEESSSAPPIFNRKPYTYERRLLHPDAGPSENQKRQLVASLSEGNNAANGPGSSSPDAGAARYIEHMRSWSEDHRPGTRGATSSADTIALLRRHDLAPPDLIPHSISRDYDDDVRLQTLTDPSADATVVVRTGQQWSPAGMRDHQTSTSMFARHPDTTSRLANTQLSAASSIPEELTAQTESEETALMRRTIEILSETIDEDPSLSSAANELNGGAENCYEDELYDDEDNEAVGVAGANLREQDSAGDGASSDVDGEVHTPPPASVVWRVDGETGTSWRHRSSRGASNATEAPADVQVADETLTEVLSNTNDIAQRAHSLYAEGEQLVGEVRFAEMIELLTRDTPVSSQEIQAFVQSRVPDPQQAAEVMYLCFRYVMLEGEIRRMRRER